MVFSQVDIFYVSFDRRVAMTPVVSILLLLVFGSVAQLDRASPSGGEGRAFESRRTQYVEAVFTASFFGRILFIQYSVFLTNEYSSPLLGRNCW